MYQLYWGTKSAAMAPQMVLEEIGLPYEIHHIDFRAGAARREPYLSINPAGYLPALVTDGGEIITESAAITLWLCENHGREDLAPAPDHPTRGLFLRSLFYLTNTVQESYKNYYYCDEFSSAGEAHGPAIRERATERMGERWKLVDDHLARSGPCHLGQALSAVDLYAVMLITWHYDPPALRARFPALNTLYALASERPAVRRVLEAHGVA